MADTGNSLDSFLTAENTSVPQEGAPAKPATSIEDEFAKLLNDFIKQDMSGSKSQTNAPAAPSGGLDGLVTPESQASEGGGLDSLVTPESQASESGGLDSLVTPESQASESGGLDSLVTPEETPAPAPQQNTSGLDTFVTQNPAEAEPEEGNENQLKAEEQELARAVSNFQSGLYAIAERKNLKVPSTDYVETMLIPNYKPSVGKKIAQFLLNSWDVVNKCDPENMKRLSKDANDEEYLTFAESLSDTDLQLVIISYVEILINLEICEVNYEQKREAAQKNKIKRELYEEYVMLQERKKLFIEKLKEKNFPIDVDRLINNYFRAAQKDPDGAFDALTKNPAMFSPIEVEKIKPKLFGLIKVTPEDGIKTNQKIGAFIKKLKV